jgi:hypothetical protein
LRLSQFDPSSANQPNRDNGTVHHEVKAAAEIAARRSINVGRILVVIALLATALLWALSR